jgi:SAM-dependent methyltransferase
MQAYSSAFARIYNLRWGDFARAVAPRIQAYYERTPLGSSDRTLLDICCGTGQLAIHFAGQGYQATGLDLSAPMLAIARQNAAPYVESGQIQFIQGDAAQFRVDEPVGLALSTFDALNHLPGQDAMRACMACAYTAVKPEGTFIFDLNTRRGLDQWNGVQVQDTEEYMIVTRGLFDQESSRAWTRISGFLRTEGELYQRFEQTAYNTLFDMAWVEQALYETGWDHAHFARIDALDTPLTAPENESRVFIVAQKRATAI